MKKRIITIILAIVMVVGLIPANSAEAMSRLTTNVLFCKAKVREHFAYPDKIRIGTGYDYYFDIEYGKDANQFDGNEAYKLKIKNVKSNNKNLKITDYEKDWKKIQYQGARIQFKAKKAGTYKITYDVLYRFYKSKKTYSEKVTTTVYVDDDAMIEGMRIGGSKLEICPGAFKTTQFYSKKSKGKMVVKPGKNYEITKISCYGPTEYYEGAEKSLGKNGDKIVLNNKIIKVMKGDKTATDKLSRTAVQIGIRDKLTNKSYMYGIKIYTDAK